MKRSADSMPSGDSAVIHAGRRYGKTAEQARAVAEARERGETVLEVGKSHGGSRPGAGRPPIDEPRSIEIKLRLTPGEYARLEIAAAASGKPLAAWAREKLLRGTPK